MSDDRLNCIRRVLASSRTHEDDYHDDNHWQFRRLRGCPEGCLACFLEEIRGIVMDSPASPPTSDGLG